jgi:hypothetical protein
VTNVPARTCANRVNALLSTGPRTPTGLARSAQNALKVGLFSRHIVLPVLGESEQEYDAFRAAIGADLDPVGMIEAELAERVAQLLWRLRRVVRYETEAQCASMAALPPHPDQVQPDGGHPDYRPLPPDAPAAERLARVRAALGSGLRVLATRQAALAALEAALAKPSDTDGSKVPLERTPVLFVLGAAAGELGRAPDPDPWAPVLEQLGFRRTDPARVNWTATRLLKVLRAAARIAWREFVPLAGAVHNRLQTEIDECERRIQEQADEEARLVAELLREREAEAAALLCADAGGIERVARAESHLSRELDRTLMVLARLRLGRGSGGSDEPIVGAGGFVLQTGIAGVQ